VCGPVRLPVDGIRDYADCLAASLRDRGLDVEVDHDRPDARDADVVLVQYNPFSYGKRGFAPWLPPTLRDLRRRTPRPRVCLIVHETYVPAENWRWAIMGAWQRRQLKQLLALSDVVFATIETRVRELANLGAPRPVEYLPVGSNLPDMRHVRTAARERLGIVTEALAIGAFGTGHPARRTNDIARAAISAAACGVEVVVLNLGAGAPPIDDVPPTVRVITPGRLDAAAVAEHLAAADMFVAPYLDGVSTRRTTVMAALQHGLPVVGTDGPLTDDLLRESRDALVLVPVADRERMDDAIQGLVLSGEDRQMRAAAARALFERCFDWPVITSKLMSALALDTSASQPV
jgi:glycosyltransferase involved in cell wall biosynthesis